MEELCEWRMWKRWTCGDGGHVMECGGNVGIGWKEHGFSW